MNKMSTAIVFPMTGVSSIGLHRIWRIWLGSGVCFIHHPKFEKSLLPYDFLSAVAWFIKSDFTHDPPQEELLDMSRIPRYASQEVIH